MHIRLTASGVLKTLASLFGLLAISAVIAFYSLPALLKSKLPALIEQKTGGKSSIAGIELHLSPLFINIQGFEIKESNDQRFAAFDTLYVRLNARQSIKQSALVIDDVSLKKPFVRIARQKNGSFNFQNLFRKNPEQPKDSGIFPVAITKLSVSDGKLTWEDAHFNKPVKENLDPINIDIKNFSVQADKTFDLGLSLTLSSGGRLEWKGTVGISPLASEGRIKLDKVDLQKVLAVALPDISRFDLNGNGLIDTDYKLRYANKSLSISANKAKIDIHGLLYAVKGQHPREAKIADFSHETDFKCNYTDNALTLGAKQSRITVHDIQYTEKDRLVKIPDLTFETDINAAHGPKGWQLSVNKSKLDSRELQYAQKEQQLKIDKLAHDTDLKADFSENAWRLAAGKAKIDSKGIQLAGFGPGKLLAKIPAVTLETAYKVDYADKKLTLTGTGGTIDSRDFQLSEQGKDKTLVKMPVFGMHGINFNLDKYELKIASIAAKSLDLQAWLNADGTLNYQSLMAPGTARNGGSNTVKPSPETEKADASKSPASPVDAANTSAAGNIAEKKNQWNIQVNALTLTDSGLVFEDRSLEKPLTFTVKPIDFKLSNYSNQSGAALPFELSAGVNKSGSIKLTGDTVIEPFSANINTNVDNIDLETFQPYFDRFVNLDIIDGMLHIDGKLSMAKTSAGNKPDVQFNGNAGIGNLLTRDQKVHKDFVKWDNLSLKNIVADLPANRYTASELVIDKPYARVTIRKDKTVNFSDIIKAKNKSEIAVKTDARRQAGQDKNKPYFKLDKIQVRAGASDFSDLSLILPFAAQIESLDGGATGISSEKKSAITAHLEGSAYDLSPVNVKAELNPHQGQYNVQINFNGLPMPLISPYMVQFAGYKVEKGKITLALNYNVTNSQLTASNNILIDQFELGDKVENPKAVSLPLELAVALLKDSDGKIKIDVPVTGSLDDPQFSIGAIVTDALVNALTKIVSAPFQALGSLLDGDEDLSTITFSAGSSALTKTQQAKLDSLSKALRERPALNLAIKGAVYQEQDWPAIREDALYDQLKIRKATEINQKSEKKIRAQYVELTEDEYKRLLADMFIEKFPLLAEKSFLGTPQLTNPKAGDFHAIAKQKLFGVIKPEEERLKELASARARAIAKYVVQKGNVQTERVFILDTVIDPKRENSDITSTLSLKAN